MTFQGFYSFKVLIAAALLFVFSHPSSALIIDDVAAASILTQLSHPQSYPHCVKSEEDIHIKTNMLKWDGSSVLCFWSKQNIIFEPGSQVTSLNSKAKVWLKSGMENPTGRGTVIFLDETPHIFMNGGEVRIYYNPDKGDELHKYHNAQYFDSYVTGISEKDVTVLSYVLVNTLDDLQQMNTMLSQNYALSQNVDASPSRQWNRGKGFTPIRQDLGERGSPFSGNFDGNGYTISDLYINRPKERKVGLFGMIAGYKDVGVIIENLTLLSPSITGLEYVGALTGWVTDANFRNIKVVSPRVSGEYIVGGIIGTALEARMESTTLSGEPRVDAHDQKGWIVGAASRSVFQLYFASDQQHLLENAFVPIDRKLRPDEKKAGFEVNQLGWFRSSFVSLCHSPDAVD